jgi:hypothetical protein
VLAVTLTLRPARGGKPEKIGTLTIVNTGTGTMERGNYFCSLVSGKRERTACVVGHERERGAWALVRAALDAIEEEL